LDPTNTLPAATTGGLTGAWLIVVRQLTPSWGTLLGSRAASEGLNPLRSAEKWN
jgi:hypothetical protein